MVTLAQDGLRGTEGFVLESPEGDLGRIEEVWLGDTNEPRALVVRTLDGWHGLLLGEYVLAVDREHHWVVVPSEPALLELDAPHVIEAETGDGRARLAARWETTGDVHRVARQSSSRLRLPAHAAAASEPVLWRAVVVLLGSIALLVVLVTALAFVVARLITGDAY